jgi:hypothetical protein
MPRPVKCDFCSAPLDVRGWEFPAADFQYPDARRGPGLPAGAVVGGSLGSWLACETCKRLVRQGFRDQLVDRSVERFFKLNPSWRQVMTEATLRLNIRDSHDRFWSHRQGAGHPITRDLLDQLAEEAPFEPNPHWRPQ